MNILYDHQAISMQRYGGITRYFHEITNLIAGIAGNRVEIFSPLYVNEYFKPGDLVRPTGIHVPAIPRSLRIIRTLNNFVSLKLKMRRDVDIFHETYYSSKRLAPKNAKVVLTVYDMIHERFSDHFLRSDTTSRKKALAVERADHVICISEQTRQDLIELRGVNPAKISVVYLGFTLTKQRESVRNADTPAHPFLLYVGDRGGYKNFESLLQAYAASSTLKKDFELICFGGGKFTPKEKILLQRLGLSMERVRQVSGDDTILARYYSLASAFIYPSLYEGFGIPPLEAMSFACPVVCSSVSSIPEVVGNAGEMFDPYEPESIRLAIERVVSDDALRQILIARGQEQIKLFSWKRCAQETLDVYRRVIS